MPTKDFALSRLVLFIRVRKELNNTSKWKENIYLRNKFDSTEATGGNHHARDKTVLHLTTDDF